MRTIKKVFSEEDFIRLNVGDYSRINGKPAMKRGQVRDGMKYVINNGDRTITKMNLRGFHIINGGIIPVWYSERIINLNKKDLEEQA